MENSDAGKGTPSRCQVMVMSCESRPVNSTFCENGERPSMFWLPGIVFVICTGSVGGTGGGEGGREGGGRGEGREGRVKSIISKIFHGYCTVLVWSEFLTIIIEICCNCSYGVVIHMHETLH